MRKVLGLQVLKDTKYLSVRTRCVLCVQRPTVPVCFTSILLAEVWRYIIYIIMFYISSASHFRKSFDWATDILSGAGWVPHNNIFVQSDERKFPGRSGRGQKTKRDLNRELKEFEEVDNKRSSSGGIGVCDDGKDYCEDPRGNEIISFQWKKFF